MSAMPSRSNLDRLLALPPVFTLQDVRRLGLSDGAEHIFIMRMSQAGRIAPAGPRASVYFNLVRDGQGPLNRRVEAAAMLYPSAVVVGAAVLHAEGWITQIPQVVDLAVLERRSTRQVDGINFVVRPKSWYFEHADHIVPATESAFGVPALAPAAALADARERGDLWVPDDDDIDWQHVEAPRRLRPGRGQG